MEAGEAGRGVQMGASEDSLLFHVPVYTQNGIALEWSD